MTLMGKVPVLAKEKELDQGQDRHRTTRQTMPVLDLVSLRDRRCRGKVTVPVLDLED